MNQLFFLRGSRIAFFGNSCGLCKTVTVRFRQKKEGSVRVFSWRDSTVAVVSLQYRYSVSEEIPKAEFFYTFLKIPAIVPVKKCRARAPRPARKIRSARSDLPWLLRFRGEKFSVSTEREICTLRKKRCFCRAKSEENRRDLRL